MASHADSLSSLRAAKLAQAQGSGESRVAHDVVGTVVQSWPVAGLALHIQEEVATGRSVSGSVTGLAAPLAHALSQALRASGVRATLPGPLLSLVTLAAAVRTDPLLATCLGPAPGQAQQDQAESGNSLHTCRISRGPPSVKADPW